MNWFKAKVVPSTDSIGGNINGLPTTSRVAAFSGGTERKRSSVATTTAKRHRLVRESAPIIAVAEGLVDNHHILHTHTDRCDLADHLSFSRCDHVRSILRRRIDEAINDEPYNFRPIVEMLCPEMRERYANRVRRAVDGQNAEKAQRDNF